MLLTSTVVAVLGLVACGGTTPIVVPDAAPAPEVLSQLWVDPGAQPRDLYLGVGGQRYAPAADAVYVEQARDESGFSVSYDVVDPAGVEWSAKVGAEAQTEVVVSRILWGLGYHQPPVYYLPAWRFDPARDEIREERGARFRPKLARLDRQKEYWRWAENPFMGAPEFRALLVTLLMLNGTDLKDDNNSIYQLPEPWFGASRWFVVRDIGAALGETGSYYPRRNWLEGFEKEPFLTRVDGERVEFGYDGRHKELLTMVSGADVRLAARRLQALTDVQWRDAFRAAGYATSLADDFIRRINEKIDDGLALRVDRRASDD